MDLLPFIMMCGGAFLVLMMIALAFSGPSAQRVGARRLSGLKDRSHGVTQAPTVDQQIRKITGKAATKTDDTFARFLPKPAILKHRLSMTGKTWTIGQYGTATLIITTVIAGLMILEGVPVLLGLLVGLMIGGYIPHFVVGFLIKRRINKFTAKFPDAIELMVRGLRSGLPITETMSVVGSEIEGPVGEEFRMVADRMKIGRTMDVALQETADRLQTPEFQFFVITINIQRETGGNLAETLANLADVLRKRAQMKLKIKAMSSESKASAYIVGSLPFIVFALIWMTAGGDYLGRFFTDTRLIITGIGGLVWMAIGAFIMAKMVNFEI